MAQKVIKWEDKTQLSEIKELFAPNLTDGEFKTFIGIGKVTGLNPFLKEIWAVKGFGQNAQIFIARDGYRKSAQANKDYDYHYSDAVYSNDTFEVHNGIINHKYDLKNRGKLLGAYTIVKRKSSSQAVYNYVDFIEYFKGNKVIVDFEITTEIKKSKNGLMGETLWDTKPATMIKKVSENQGLRQNFQELFAGTYGEEEAYEDNQEAPQAPSEETQAENYKKYTSKFITSETINELREVYIELQKEIKNDKDFITKEQTNSLIKLKDEVIKRIEENQKIQDGEVEIENNNG